MLVMFCRADCMQKKNNLQTGQAVKEFAYECIPFANGDLLSLNEFTCVWERYVETAFNPLTRVLHEFSRSVSEVRRGLHKRADNDDIMR